MSLSGTGSRSLNVEHLHGLSTHADGLPTFGYNNLPTSDLITKSDSTIRKLQQISGRALSYEEELRDFSKDK